MDQGPKHEQVRSRNENFAERISTQIWQETPAADNPYITAALHCQGYDLRELMRKRSFVDVFYLMFRGDLPSRAQAQLLEQLMIALITPGPRHPASRAAMNVGVGKTHPVHILPIAASVLGGDYAGGGEVESAMRWLSEHINQPVIECLAQEQHESTGFGRRQGGVQLLAVSLGEQLSQLDGAGPHLRWGVEMSRALGAQGKGWLMTGVAAAAFLDLGFAPRAGACLLQLLGAPGLVAQGLEYAGKPLVAMPFVSDDNYVIET